MDQGQHLEVVRLFLQGMVEKDRAALEKSMCKDAYLYPLSGRRESREEYIRDIQNVTLNYYDYRIEEADAKR